MGRLKDALRLTEERRETRAEIAREGGVVSPVFHQTPIILPVDVWTPVGDVLLARAQFYFDRISDERELIRRKAVIRAIGIENMNKFLIHMEEIHNIADVFSLTNYSDQIDKLRGTAQGIYLSA